MKKSIICILFLLVLVGCKTPEDPIINTQHMAAAISSLVENENIVIYEANTYKVGKDTTITNIITNFGLSFNENIEMGQTKKTRINGREQSAKEEENYIFKADEKYYFYKYNGSKEEVNISDWQNFMLLNILLSALIEKNDSSNNIYSIAAIDLYDKIKNGFSDQINLNKYQFENKKLEVKVFLKNQKIDQIKVDLTSFFNQITSLNIEKAEYVLSFTTGNANIIKPLWITDASDYKIIPLNREYPHINEDPSSVVVKHIDIGKYDRRDSGNTGSNLYLEQDKGESTYIRIGNIDILIDAGQNNNNGATVLAIKEVINENSWDGILDYVIVTHPDADHYGGMASILSEYQVKMIIETSGTSSNYGWQNYMNYRNMKVNSGSGYCKAMDMINNKSNACQKVLYIAPSVTITFLNTGYLDSTAATNPTSIVFVLNAFNTTYLLQGDAEKAQEANYASMAGKINVMKMPHHGTKNATENYFLSKCNPDNIIIQNGNNLGNRYGHPTSATINRIYAYNNQTNIYAVTGGGFGSYCTYSMGGEKTCSVSSPDNDFWESFDSNRFLDRNGTITTTIIQSGYMITSELPEVLEISKTRFWQQNNNARYYNWLA